MDNPRTNSSGKQCDLYRVKIYLKIYPDVTEMKWVPGFTISESEEWLFARGFTCFGSLVRSAELFWLGEEYIWGTECNDTDSHLLLFIFTIQIKNFLHAQIKMFCRLPLKRGWG